MNYAPNITSPPPVGDIEWVALARHVRIKVVRARTVDWSSGVIINCGRQGTEILTNKHAVGRGDGAISVDDGTDYWRGIPCREVWPLGSPMADDVAVIMAEKQPPPGSCAYLAPLGYQPQEPLYAIGSMHGGLPSVIKTRIEKRWTDTSGKNVLLLGAASCNGDSGGAIFDSRGVLVGISWACDGTNGYAVDLTKSSTLTAGTRAKSQARSVALGM